MIQLKLKQIDIQAKWLKAIHGKNVITFIAYWANLETNG